MQDHVLTAVAFERKAELGGGFRARVIDRRSHAAHESPVCTTMQEARHWARTTVNTLMAGTPWQPGYSWGARWTMNVFRRA